MGIWNPPFDYWFEVGIEFETLQGLGNHPEKCLVHGKEEWRLINGTLFRKSGYVVFGRCLDLHTDISLDGEVGVTSI